MSIAATFTPPFSPRLSEAAALAPYSALSELLDQPLHSEFELAKSMESGAPAALIERLVARGFSRRELEFVIPARTLSHRIKHGQALTTDESDRALRMAKLLLQAEALFGNPAQAASWLREPKQRFEGRTPLEMARTEQGAQLVSQLLGQAGEGYCA